jgi:hypothetical protein
VQEIEAAKGREVALLEEMARQVGAASSGAAGAALSADIRDYQAVAEERWDGDSVELLKRQLHRQKEQIDDLTSKLIKRTPRQMQALRSWLTKNNLGRLLQNWRVWVRSRRSLEEEGADLLHAIQQQALPSPAGGGRRGRPQYEVDVPEEAIAMLVKQLETKQKDLTASQTAAKEERRKAERSQRVVESLQKELGSTLDVALETQERSRRTHKEMLRQGSQGVPGPGSAGMKVKSTGLTQTLGQLQQPLIGILSQTAGSTDKFWVNPVDFRLWPTRWRAPRGPPAGPTVPAASTSTRRGREGSERRAKPQAENPKQRSPKS